MIERSCEFESRLRHHSQKVADIAAPHSTASSVGTPIGTPAKGVGLMFSYLQVRGQTYYYRIKIPSDLRPFFPSREIKRSLKTRDKRAARTLATAYHSKVQNTFALLRAGTTPTPQSADLISTLLGTTKTLQIIEAPTKRIPTLKQLIQQYQQEKAPKWSQKTALEFGGILAILIELMADKPIDSYSREDAIKCREALLRLPSNYKKRSRANFSSIWAAIENNILPTLHTKTVNKHLVLLSSIFKYAVQNNHIQSNIAEGLLLPISKDVQSERKTYSAEDLKRIFTNLPRIESAPEKFWVPMIAMYSGIRLDEICQLHTEDIQEVEGILCFNINSEGDKKLKTEASKRLVPVHPSLIELGLLSQVDTQRASGEDRLWSNLTPNKYGYWGKQLGNWYGRFNRKFITIDPKKCFHSFRHTVADMLKQQGFNPEVISELLGHANHSITTGRYAKRYQSKVLYEAISSLRIISTCNYSLTMKSNG